MIQMDSDRADEQGMGKRMGQQDGAQFLFSVWRTRDIIFWLLAFCLFTVQVLCQQTYFIIYFELQFPRCLGVIERVFWPWGAAEVAMRDLPTRR